MDVVGALDDIEVVVVVLVVVVVEEVVVVEVAVVVVVVEAVIKVQNKNASNFPNYINYRIFRT